MLLSSCDAFADVASWYSAGKITANGERFYPYKYTAAHRTLAFGTIVRVTNPTTKKHIDVRINDNGPFVRGRTIDLSKAAFKAIADLDTGVIDVELRVVRSGGIDRRITGKHLDR
jgi:rare lipoprotein A